MQIKEFAEFMGVSVRTLHYYDEIGLLKPASVDRSTGYRFYDENSLLRMQEILFYRELDFSLKRIGDILSSPHYDKNKALQEQKQLLTLKKERLERLISAIDGAVKGENVMITFDSREIESYKEEAKARWGDTALYTEYTEKIAGKNEADLFAGMHTVLAAFSDCMKRGNEPDSHEAQALVKELQDYISTNFYTCTKEILAGLGQMYTADARFKANIDTHGEGTAQFIGTAIRYFCT
ncbi:MAG: MerR family transcriptional regulator [Oscillospiraceae bacterium]|nr:MerR family transcriptional regulator [Oscillospiraceae bacterium]